MWDRQLSSHLVQQGGLDADSFDSIQMTSQYGQTLVDNQTVSHQEKQFGQQIKTKPAGTATTTHGPSLLVVGHLPPFPFHHD